MPKESALSKSERESWMNNRWRPAMGWMYMAVCITDFILYPVFWAIFQSYNNISPIKPWDPLTLQGAGLFHMAMGAVLGVAVFGRTQEKIAGVNNVSTPTVATSGGTLSYINQANGSVASGTDNTGIIGSKENSTRSDDGNSGVRTSANQTLTAGGKKVIPIEEPIL